MDRAYEGDETRQLALDVGMSPVARRTRLTREAKRTGNIYTAPAEEMPATDAGIRTWLEGLFYIRRDFDLSTLQSAVPLDLRGRTAADMVDNVLNPLRVNVAHALFGNSGELPLSSDDLIHTHKITHRLL